MAATTVLKVGDMVYLRHLGTPCGIPWREMRKPVTKITRTHYHAHGMLFSKSTLIRTGGVWSITLKGDS